MPANEASGIGGRSYGRVALYLQEVSLARFVLHYNNSIRLETLRFFLVKIKIVAIIREVRNSSRCLLRNRISSKPKHKKDGKKKKATIENRLRPETHVCVCVFVCVILLYMRQTCIHFAGFSCSSFLVAGLLVTFSLLGNLYTVSCRGRRGRSSGRRQRSPA